MKKTYAQLGFLVLGGFCLAQVYAAPIGLNPKMKTWHNEAILAATRDLPKTGALLKMPQSQFYYLTISPAYVDRILPYLPKDDDCMRPDRKPSGTHIKVFDGYRLTARDQKLLNANLGKTFKFQIEPVLYKAYKKEGNELHQFYGVNVSSPQLIKLFGKLRPAEKTLHISIMEGKYRLNAQKRWVCIKPQYEKEVEHFSRHSHSIKGD